MLLLGPEIQVVSFTKVKLPNGWLGNMAPYTIHRGDIDAHCHSHPWKKAYSLILTDGYFEERVADNSMPDVKDVRWFLPGDLNTITETTFHRLLVVLPGTWSAFLAGERTGKSWGFLVAPDFVVDHEDYETTDGRPVGKGFGL